MTADQLQTQLQRNSSIIEQLPPAPPKPSAKFCKESTHRMLRHLTACQSAWLPIMKGISLAEPKIIAEHPVKLFNRKSMESAEWSTLIDLFSNQRQEWEKILETADPLATIKTQTKSYTVLSLTRRLVLHKSMHLAEHNLL